MAIYKLIRASKKNKLKLTLLWRSSGYTIIAKETNAKGVIRLSGGRVTKELGQAIAIFELLAKECISVHSLKELKAEIEDKYNMLIL